MAGFLANVKNTSATSAVSRRAVEAAQRTVELTEQGQVTERYARAVEQLGSDKLDVRIGGIYALERIARDSPRDHPTIMEVLAAFIREHSHEQWPPTKEGAEPLERATRPDVQAAVTVIGRRTTGHDSQPINLIGANFTSAGLVGANLTGANLTRADFTEADLTRANLTEADLTQAKLIRANLTEANLTNANPGLASLTGADLIGADLTGANLVGADLTGLNLFHANFTEADLIEANLTRAALFGADLTGANLFGAQVVARRAADPTGPPDEVADFTRANLTGVDLIGVDLTGVNLTGANLTEADLAKANLAKANLTDTRWPEGTAIPPGWRRDTHSGHLKKAHINPPDSGSSPADPAPGT